VLRRREVVQAVIRAGTNSINLVELLDHLGIASVLLGNSALGESLDFRNRHVIFRDVKRDSCHSKSSSIEMTLNP
jgi:hypothetical protein